MYYETPYYLEPEKGSAKAYALLREALKHSKKVAIGRYVLRQHEHLGVIKVHENLLVLNQLRYDAELIHPKELNIPKKEALQKKELDVALKLIDALSQDFEPAKYTDSYTEEVKEMIEKKAKGHRTKIKKTKTIPSPKVHDIMHLLKESLQQHQKKQKRKSA
jgi:DNA end-binding protein Ku